MEKSIFNKEELMNFLNENYTKMSIGNSFCNAIDDNNIEIIKVFEEGFEVLHKRFNPDTCEDEIIRKSGFINFEDCPKRIELQEV